MAKGRTKRYNIELEISRSDATNKNISDIEQAFNKISESAKSIDLSKGLEAATNEADKLSKSIQTIVSNQSDATQEIDAFSKAANSSIKELEKQAVIIQNSLSEQGKAQRERLKELKAELQTLGNTSAERKRRKEIEKEVKTIQKSVSDASDDELKAALATNRQLRAKLKISQSEAKLSAAQKKSQKSLKDLVKGDLSMMKEKYKEQLKFIQALKTTEGRYNAIKKAAGKIGQFGKTALKGAGLVAGGALALGGVAMASAQSQVEREDQARRIKGALSQEEKNNLLSDLYIQTGSDYSTIVDAINRVQSVLGGKASQGELLQATSAEIRYPGAAAMFRQQNTGDVTSTNFAQYQNRMKALQTATGASVEQVTASTQKIANMRQSSFSNASMTDLQSIYLALQNSGAYDTDDELDRAFRAFVRAQRGSGKDVFDFAKVYFENEKTAGRGVWGAQNKQQALKAISNLDISAIRSAASVSSSETELTDAQKTAMEVRKMEEQKNQILVKLVNAIAPVFEQLGSSEISKIINGLIDMLTKVVPVLLNVLNAIAPYISKFISFITYGIEKITEVIEKIVEKLGIKPNEAGVSGQARANGGIVSIPSIVGEAGAEAVIPLDHSRVARSSNIVSNITQNFSMSGNETTVLSLSQAVKSRGFQRAINNQNLIQRRLGR